MQRIENLKLKRVLHILHNQIQARNRNQIQDGLDRREQMDVKKGLTKKETFINYLFLVILNFISFYLR